MQYLSQLMNLLKFQKNRFLSAADFLEKPSAIFKCTETAALLICCVKAYFSSGGKERVVLYMHRTNSLDAEKISKRVCDNLRNIKNGLPQITFSLNTQIRYLYLIRPTHD